MDIEKILKTVGLLVVVVGAIQGLEAPRSQRIAQAYVDLLLQAL